MTELHHLNERKVPSLEHGGFFRACDLCTFNPGEDGVPPWNDHWRVNTSPLNYVMFILVFVANNFIIFPLGLVHTCTHLYTKSAIVYRQIADFVCRLLRNKSSMMWNFCYASTPAQLSSTCSTTT